MPYQKDLRDPPMEGWKNLYSRVRVLQIASFEGPMILRVSINPYIDPILEVQDT